MFVTTLLFLILRSCFKLYPVHKGTHLASILAVIMAGVPVPSLELGSEDVHGHELSPPFLSVFAEVFLM